MAADPPALRPADIETFLLVHRLSSITAAARELTVTPSQASKAVARLEAHVGSALLRRSARGVSLTEAGRRLLPRLEEITIQLRNLTHAEDQAGVLVTIAAPSYLNAFLLPAMAEALPHLRIRSLEMPPSLVRTFTAANLFDATLLLGAPRLPASWVTTRIGVSRKALFSSPRTSRDLGRQPVRPEQLRGLPFIRPVYSMGGQFVPVDDDCPLSIRQRKNGHEAQTLGVALDLAARTDQLVYGPAFAASHHFQRGTIVEIEVEGWNSHEDLWLACNGERVLARVQDSFVAALKDAFARLERGSRHVQLPGS